MAFVKIDSGILDSSLWADSVGVKVFLTALAKCEPYELSEGMEALSVRSLEAAGFAVPAGWYGLARVSGTALVRAAQVDMEEGLAALERLCAPDLDSRNPAYEGRRLVRVPGGYLALNYDVYRQRDLTAAERMRRYRARKSQDDSGADCAETPESCEESEANVTPVTQDVTAVTRNGCNGTANVTEEEVEEEVEDLNPPPTSSLSDGGGGGLVPPQAAGAAAEIASGPSDAVFQAWNAAARASGLTTCRRMTAKRVQAVRARWRDQDWRAHYHEALERLRGIRWVRGANPRKWVANIDWFLRPDTVNKLLEGAYDDNSDEPGYVPPDAWEPL